MFLRCCSLLFLILSVSCLSSLHDERRATIERVRNYLQRSEATSRNLLEIVWLPNSNKIGFGYNPLSGSPVCYTSKCQMEGFTRSIFKLNYSMPAPGACTTKWVPNNVDLDCLPGVSMKTDSEIIDTVEQLQRSVTRKTHISSGIKFKGVEFSYEFSKETRHMIDNIVKNHRTAMYTSAEISFVKLSMFELKMELSDNFKYVIENMPCCDEDDPDIEDYVNEFIFNYYGFAYVTSILLGGVAHQNIFIDRAAKSRLETRGVDIKHEAKLMFDASQGVFGGSAHVSAGLTKSTTYPEYGNNFSEEVKSIDSGSFGGDPSLTTLVEWSKTVASNPVVTEFSLQDITRLFTKRYFPSDPLITIKAKLVEKTLEKYLSGPIFCYGDCGGNETRGTCEPTGYFKFGIYKCKPGWTGSDCAEVERPKILFTYSEAHILMREKSRMLHVYALAFVVSSNFVRTLSFF